MGKGHSHSTTSGMTFVTSATSPGQIINHNSKNDHSNFPVLYKNLHIFIN